jgi:RimJ/RimL family protein N-acetyltransferase
MSVTIEEVLVTHRLRLRKFTVEDAPFIIELVNTPGWLRFIGDRHIHTLEQAVQYIENGPAKSYSENGFGLSMVETLKDRKSIGMCGLLKREQLDVPDIGFAFLPQYMCMGYAYEAAQAAVLHAHEVLGLPKLAAITLPENERSIRLLEKMNFRFEKKIKLAAEELLQYTHP